MHTNFRNFQDYYVNILFCVKKIKPPPPAGSRGFEICLGCKNIFLLSKYYFSGHPCGFHSTLCAGFKLFRRAVRQPFVQYTATCDAVMFHKAIVQLLGNMAAHIRAKVVFLRSAEKKADSHFSADKCSATTTRSPHAPSEGGGRSEEFQRT